MLGPWSQQARQLTPRRGTVAHLRNRGCGVHIHRRFIYRGVNPRSLRGAPLNISRCLGGGSRHGKSIGIPCSRIRRNRHASKESGLWCSHSHGKRTEAAKSGFPIRAHSRRHAVGNTHESGARPRFAAGRRGTWKVGP